MDRKPRKPSRKPTSKNNRSAKNAGFVALMILFSLIIFAAYNQPSTLKEIDTTQAIADANAGKYKKIAVNGNQLSITLKGQEHPLSKPTSTEFPA